MGRMNGGVNGMDEGPSAGWIQTTTATCAAAAKPSSTYPCGAGMPRWPALVVLPHAIADTKPHWVLPDSSPARTGFNEATPLLTWSLNRNAAPGRSGHGFNEATPLLTWSPAQVRCRCPMTARFNEATPLLTWSRNLAQGFLNTFN